MYTVSISDDGMFGAEYVVPSAMSIPLGSSGTNVDVIKNEDGTFSALINGEYEVVTADTMVTAENGNVYRALLSPEGIVIGVMHVQAMQDVMLGDLGGTITLTQKEDMSWSYGEAAVATGYMHTAANGNVYMLTLDSEGMWSAMYQPVEATVALGTQGAITLVRAEDMSWWLGSEGVDVASEVMSDNGNTYSLWYTDGVWSARFEPESMMIAGTGLTAMTREADDMYDVDGDTLPASGAGEITTSAGAMYRVSMMDGMLSGVRFDGAPKVDTVHVTVGLFDSELGGGDDQLSYIADDRDTAFNEANTKLTVAGENISLGDLLGDGMAVKAAAASDGVAGEFVKSAVEELMDLRTEAELYAKYQAAAEDDAGRSAFDGRLNSIAERAQGVADMIFGTYIEADADATPAIAIGDKKVNLVADGTLPTEDTDNDLTNGFTLSATDYIRATQTVRGLNRLLDALSSADAFVAATMDGNNGVFENALGEDAARDAFSANKSEYMVYFGTTENTRYGAIALKERKSDEFTPTGETEATVEAAAVYKTRFEYDGTPATDNDVEVGKVGAFSYATVNDTLRARNLLQTGGAVYTGGTVAATPAGTLYSGDMRIDVNFRQQSVFGRVSGLMDKDNNLWKYLDSDVDTIYLPRQNYNSLTQFGGSGGEDPKRTGTGEFKTATVVYSQSQGFSTTPTEQPRNARFAGRFIGDDGAEITGTWSLGQPQGPDTPTDTADANTAKSNNLDVIFGSYGVTRQDSSGPVGPADGTAGGRVKTEVVLPVTARPTGTPNGPLGATFAGDKDTAAILRLGKRSIGGGEVANNDFDLTTIFAQPGADPKKTVSNAPTHVSVVVDHIEAQRAIYVIYAEQVGGDSADLTDLANEGRQSAWESINDFVRDHIFDVAAVAPDPANTDGADSAVLEVADVTDVENLSSPLGSYFYPMTRNGRPDDDAALERIDAVLAAFADRYAFEAALEDDGGGVFDSQPALDAGVAGTTPDPFPLDTVDNTPAADGTDTAGYSAEPVGDIFGRISSQTQLFSLSTDYTRFGVWFRRDTDSAVHDWANHASPNDGADTPVDTGSTSPGSYAYSWLDQSAYRTDRAVATYPSNGLATYEGKTLVNVRNTHIYVGDALIRVNWSATTVVPITTNSTIVPIFSNFRKWQDGSLDRLVHNHDADDHSAADFTPSKIVDEIVFRTSAGADLPVTADDDGQLRIEFTDAAATITYTDGTRIGTAVPASTFMGKFVGSSSDGPLGILGTWEVPGFDEGTIPANSNDVNDVVGSFGADLTSFETLLP